MTITQTDTVSTAIVATSAGKAMATATATLKSDLTATTPATFFDSIINEISNCVAWNEYEIQTLIGSNYTIENLSACQTLSGKIVAPVGNGGIGRIRVSDGVVSNILKCDTTKRSEQTFREFTEYAEGSVARYLYDQISPMFDSTPDVDYFSTYNHSAAAYTRNPACWAASVDLSCVVVASNSGSGWTRQRGGVLITPRHILIARHFPYGIGTQVRFSNAGGTIETRTVIGTSAASNTADLWVCTLDSSVSVASPCPVTGDWLVQGLESLNGEWATWWTGGVAVYTDQDAKIHACGIGYTTTLSQGPFGTLRVNGIQFPNCTTYAWAEPGVQGPIPTVYSSLLNNPVPGDSGQPIFVLINGSPVLLWVWTFPGGGVPTYLHNGAILNALIAVADVNAGISTGYTVTVAPDPTA